MNIFPLLILTMGSLLLSSNTPAAEIEIFKAAREGDRVAIQKYVQQGGDINISNTKSLLQNSLLSCVYR